MGRLLSSVIFETHSYYSPFSTLCAAGLTVDWGKTGHIHAMHDLLSYVALALPGKGPQRTVVQVVDCTRLPSKRKNGGCILHKRGHLFLIQQRLYEIVIRRETLPHSPPKKQKQKPTATPLPKESCPYFEIVALFKPADKPLSLSFREPPHPRHFPLHG